MFPVISKISVFSCFRVFQPDIHPSNTFRLLASFLHLSIISVFSHFRILSRFLLFPPPAFIQLFLNVYCNKISAFPTFSVFWQDFLRLFDFSYFRILSRFVPFPSFSSFPISVFQQDALLTFPSFSEMFYDSFRLFLFPYFIKISAISTFPSFPFFSIALFPYFSCFPYFSIFSVFFVFS